MNNEGNLFVDESFYGPGVLQLLPDGTTSLYAPASGSLVTVFDSHDNLYGCPALGDQIVRIDLSGQTSLYATAPVLIYNFIVDHRGDVFVSSISSNAVFEITPQGVATQLPGVFARDFAIDSQGNVFACDKTIYEIAVDGTISTYATTTFAESIAVLVPEPSTVGLAGLGLAAILVWSTRRLAHGLWCVRRIAPALALAISAVGNDAARADYQLVRTFGSFGSGAGQLHQPGGIASASTGNLFVADVGNSRIDEFDSAGSYVGVIGTFGHGNGQLAGAFGVTTDPVGNVWVADSANNRIQEFASNGSYLNQFGSFGVGAGQLVSPHGIAIDSLGNVWVADTFNDRIEEFTNGGAFIRAVGEFGMGDGQFLRAGGVAIDSFGHLWAVDSGNSRIQEFTSGGAFITQFGAFGQGDGQLNGPGGIAIDSSGNVWVADSGNGRIEEFSSTGAYLSQFSTPVLVINNVGSFSHPVNLAIDSHDNIWVTDNILNIVEEFSLVPEPSTLALAALGFMALAGWSLKRCRVSQAATTLAARVSGPPTDRRGPTESRFQNPRVPLPACPAVFLRAGHCAARQA